PVYPSLREAGHNALEESRRNRRHQNAKIRQSRLALADFASNPGQPPRSPGREDSGGRLLAGRNGRDRLQDLRSDLVWVALRVRTTVFQVTLVAVVDEGVRHADRSAAVGHAIAERVDQARLVLA